jgi:hypothetical protein
VTTVSSPSGGNVLIDGISNIGSGIFGLLPSFYGPARFGKQPIVRTTSPVRAVSPVRLASPPVKASPVGVISPVAVRPVMPTRNSSKRISVSDEMGEEMADYGASAEITSPQVNASTSPQFNASEFRKSLNRSGKEYLN